MGAMRAIRVAATAATMAAATMISVTPVTGVAAAAPPAATAPSVPVVQPVDLGVLPGITTTSATAINDHGDIVGTGYNSPYDSHGFRWSRGVLTALPDTARAPFRITNAGQVAGNLPGRFSSPGFVIRPGGQIVSPGFSVADQGEGGHVVGTGIVAGGMHAMLWRDGRTVDLGAPAGHTSDARAVSDNGSILGEVQSSDHQDGYFARWVQGRWVPLAGPNGHGSDINGRGDVVGWATTPGGDTHATLWQGNRAIDLDPRDPLSTAVAINDAGQILGSTFDPVTDLGHILLWDQGRRIDLGTFGGQFARPIALNGRGDVVVLTSTAAFRWSHGRTVRLAGSGVPTAINNRGQVVGTILRPDGTSHAALWN